MGQDQQFMRTCQENTATEQPERIATGCRNRPKLETPALATHGTRTPHGTLPPTHARNIAGAVSWQRRAIGNLYPQFGHHAGVVQHEALFKCLSHLYAPTGGCAAENDLAQAVTRPQPG